MGYDLYRADNLGESPGHDDDRYFRASADGMAFLRRRLAIANALDETAEPPAEGSDERLPLYKLQSNAGWQVTADECRAAAARLAASTPPPTTGEPGALVLVRTFVRFLEACAAHGGCEVR